MKQQFATGPNSFAATLDDSPSVDAFSRLRVSEAQTIFEAQTQYRNNSLRMEIGATGTGVTPSFLASHRMMVLLVSAGAGGTSWSQSYQWLYYQPGKSHLILMTGTFYAPTANAVKRFGYGDTNNGVFYEQNGTAGVRFTLISSTSGAPVSNSVPQAQWNLDKLDGTGPSGITLDSTKSFILVLDLQFLGMGRVRCGFDINGVIIYAHQFLCSNILEVPYMQTACLPVKAEIVTNGAIASDAVAHFKCASVCSEAGFDIGLGRNFAAEGTVTAASGARTHILSVRPRLTFSGLENRVTFVPQFLEVLAGLNAVKWELVIGATFTVAPAWADVNTTYSAMSYGTGGTFGNLNNGVVIEAGYVPLSAKDARSQAETSILNSYPITLDRAGAVRDLGTMSVLVTGIGGTSDCRAIGNWTELR